jgi:hypothetical protein
VDVVARSAAKPGTTRGIDDLLADLAEAADAAAELVVLGKER